MLTVNRKPQTTKRGFLLIEVLLTMAILAFSLVYISRAFINCLRAMSQISGYTMAINLAEEKIFQLQSEANLRGFTPLETAGQPEEVKRYLTGFSEEGVFADEPDFNYKLEVTKLEDFSDAVSGSRQTQEGLSELCLLVNWKEEGRAGSFEINTYLPAGEK